MPAASGAKGTRDRWLIALEIHCPCLQRSEMVDIEDWQLCVHNALDRRVELQSFLLIGSLPCFCNQFISFFIV